MVKVSYTITNKGVESQCKELIFVDSIEEAREYILNEWENVEKIEIIKEELIQ